MMAAPIEAGANPESLDSNGTTPLHDAAYGGHVDTVKGAASCESKATLLTTKSMGSSIDFGLLDMAAIHGHLEVVHELINQFGIEGYACDRVTGLPLSQ